MSNLEESINKAEIQEAIELQKYIEIFAATSNDPEKARNLLNDAWLCNSRTDLSNTEIPRCLIIIELVPKIDRRSFLLEKIDKKLSMNFVSEEILQTIGSANSDIQIENLRKLTNDVKIPAVDLPELNNYIKELELLNSLENNLKNGNPDEKKHAKEQLNDISEKFSIEERGYIEYTKKVLTRKIVLPVLNINDSIAAKYSLEMKRQKRTRTSDQYLEMFKYFFMFQAFSNDKTSELFSVYDKLRSPGFHHFNTHYIDYTISFLNNADNRHVFEFTGNMDVLTLTRENNGKFSLAKIVFDLWSNKIELDNNLTKNYKIRQLIKDCEFRLSLDSEFLRKDYQSSLDKSSKSMPDAFKLSRIENFVQSNPFTRHIATVIAQKRGR